MNRRHFLITGGTGLALVGLGTLGWHFIPGNPRELTTDAALAALDNLADNVIGIEGEWNLPQVLVHCAQSIEYSLTGYPEHHSDAFKQTAGTVAFAAFSAKGRMHHGLNEAIPGAPEIEVTTRIEPAISRLASAFINFQQYAGELQEHFAYGALTKSEYEKAHVMHFYNHLEAAIVRS
ncbi:DUF1569 domain-containing protein [Alteromonas antoniana]|uniref:DUF1569 domain-containing protein n=1 Tax=Alteromonas antoniana TaxID=2803813 RepID=UPI00308449C7